MINIIELIKEVQFASALKNDVAKVQLDWKKGVIPGLVTLITTLGALYGAFGGLIPPQYAFEAAVAVSVAYLVIEGYLRLHHQVLPPVAGIPAPNVDALLALLEQKYPGLKAYEEPVKTIEGRIQPPASAPSAQ